MSSLTKRPRKKRKAEPDPELADGEEWLALAERLTKAAKSFGAEDPLEFLGWLQQKRRGYDFKADGPSPMMDLVDEIAAYNIRTAAKLAQKESN